MSKIVTAAGLALALVLIFIIGGMYVSYSRQEIQLRNLSQAQEDRIEANYDKMWKVISQLAQIQDKYKNDFLEIYPKLMAERNYGGEMMKWIQEHNPQYDSSVTKKLMVSVEANRTEFFNYQAEMTRILNEHRNLIQDPIASWFVGSRLLIAWTPITSTVAKEVRETRKDDNVDLFGKKN